MSIEMDIEELKQLVLSGKTIVANVSKKHDDRDLIRWAKDNDRFVYIGRAQRFLPEYSKKSIWFNPFATKNDTERDKVCDEFSVYLDNNASLISRLPELKGKVLGCWCYPKRCHGDYLAKLTNS